MTYADDVEYTLAFSQLQYVPLEGYLKIILPDSLSIASNPYDALKTTPTDNLYIAWQPANEGYGEESINHDNGTVGTQKYVKFFAAT